jgi:hypothetical protein
MLQLPSLCTEARHRASRWLAPIGLACVILVPDRARACGATAPPSGSTSVTAIAPGAGETGVPRDTAILVEGFSPGPAGAFERVAQVELIDVQSGASLPLVQMPWDFTEGGATIMALHAAEPLAPLRGYRIEATPFDALTEEPSGPAVITDFVTSEALLEPLVLSGELELSLEGGEAAELNCAVCGACQATGRTRRALFASVRLPLPSGGTGDYRGALHFTDDTPARRDPRNPAGWVPSDSQTHAVQMSHALILEAGEALTLRQEIYETDLDYAGCFSFGVWDGAGHLAETSACLPTLSPDQVRSLASSGGEPTPPEEVAGPVDGDDEAEPASLPDAGAANLASAGAGCAMHGNGDARPSLWLLLACVGLVARQRVRSRALSAREPT